MIETVKATVTKLEKDPSYGNITGVRVTAQESDRDATVIFPLPLGVIPPLLGDSIVVTASWDVADAS